MKMKIKSLTIILILLKFLNSDEWLVVTGADEPVYAHAGEDVTLSCSVNSTFNVTELQVEWTKTEVGIIVLQYSKGNILERYSGRAEFYIEEIPKGNFSVKLRKVRTEDKGEFRCEAYSDSDPGGRTTARIAALGYSSWIWGILVLCFAVIPVVILTVALLARNYIKEIESRQDECRRLCLEGPYEQWSELHRELHRELRRERCCQCLLVAVPAGIVCIAFILWGVTEGSREVAVTCAVISLLNILVLFIMDPNRFYPGLTLRSRRLAKSTGVSIIIVAICIISVTEFSTKYSATTAEKTELRVFVGVFVFLMVLMASVQILFFFIWTWLFNAIWTTLRKTLRRTICAITIVLIIMVLVITGLGVSLTKYTSLKTETVQVTLVQLIMFPIPFAVLDLILVFHQRSPRYQQQKQMLSLYKLSSSLNIMLNMLTLAFYIELIARLQGKSLLGYFIPISIFSLGICACFIAETYLQSFRHFYLAQKILLGILFSLHPILSLLYLSQIPENDNATKERPVNMCEFVFIYILILISNADRNRNKNFAKPHKYVYFSGAFGLPLLNSVALAVVLILKADTGKQPVDLRLIVLISGSVILFSWLVIRMCEYGSDKKEKIRKAFFSCMRRQASMPDQGPVTDPAKPKMTEEQLKFLNEVSEYHDQTKNKILKHICHYKDGMSCQMVSCSWSDGLNKNCNGGAAIRKPFFSCMRRQASMPDQPKMTEEQLKVLNEVCDRQDLTMEMIMTHMLHHKAGLSCQEAECPLSDGENQSYDGAATSIIT